MRNSKRRSLLSTALAAAFALTTLAACDGAGAPSPEGAPQAYVPPAEAETPCGVVPPLTAIAGEYDVVIGNALLSSGGRIAPARAQNTFTATMEAQGDQLMMEADGIVVVLEYTDAANFDFSRFSSVTDFNQAEFSQLVACDLARLPLLVGGGTSQSDEGTPIEFQYMLMIWSHGGSSGPRMMGTVSWGGGGVGAVRSVTASPRS